MYRIMMSFDGVCVTSLEASVICTLIVVVQVLPVSDEVVAESLRAKPPLPVVCPVVSLQPPQGTFYEPATISIPYLAKDKDKGPPTIHLMARTTGIHTSFRTVPSASTVSSNTIR